MTTNKPKRQKTSASGIYARYREILERPDLSRKEIDEMRENVRLLAQAICEHVWGKKLY